ncbi:hypothetical protein [Streptomyces sp. 3214.6]|uniref:hypothetical protein n=1 Tax=Streptomyces sp. 3214.6 TaxID=1882757 RepID=UPI000909F216|nr:hypothetical protein [Streptomyces sp. 3214.6]SHH32472.1 hypothetical protein SAMN05444521_0127 [Streptomyces sp. 3214.6]
MDANLTILLICLGVLAVASFAIWRLSSTPARIVAVIIALATLVGALKPLVELLSEKQQPTVTPGVSATSSAEGPTTGETALSDSRPSGSSPTDIPLSVTAPPSSTAVPTEVK